jgi:hypothetical protein
MILTIPVHLATGCGQGRKPDRKRIACRPVASQFNAAPNEPACESGLGTAIHAGRRRVIPNYANSPGHADVGGHEPEVAGMFLDTHSPILLDSPILFD